MIKFAENLNKMIAAGLGGALEAPSTGVAVGHGIRYLEASGAVASFETSIAAPIRSLRVAVASFETTIAAPIRSLRVDMQPIQAGSGDPSPDNIRPISGRDEVTVVRTGVNVWNEEWATGYWNKGEEVAGANIRSFGKIQIKPGETYYVNTDIYYTFYDINGTFLPISGYDAEGRLYTSGGIITAPIDAYYITFNTPSIYGSTYNHDISINYPSTDHDYHAYDGTSVAVQLGQTVYGGTLDVVSGKLTVDRAMVSYDGSENWYTSAISGGVKHRMSLDSLPSGIKIVADKAEIPDVVTNLLPAISADSSWIGTNGISMQTSYGWRIYCDAFNTSDAAPWKAYLAEHPLTVAYKLAQPFTVQLTPEQLTTILGTNNVWSDAGDVNLEYPYYEETEGY